VSGTRLFPRSVGHQACRAGVTPDFENEKIDKTIQNALKSGFTLSLVYTLPDKKPAFLPANRHYPCFFAL
jgi:hypothetical protein